MKKIIVFDDDPTGSQTVHNCPLLLNFDKEVLLKGIRSSSKLLFLLTNTRAMLPTLAEETIRGICKSLIKVLVNQDLRLEDICFISRGDSTLRGHGVLEPDVLHQELGPFDATFHVPAFFEGGRTTVDGIHLLDGLPVHKSIYSKDKIYSYSTSHLPSWIEEKSKGLIKANTIAHISLEQLNKASSSQIGMKSLIDYLLSFSENKTVVVDAQFPDQLKSLAVAVKSLQSSKRFLFRSSASFINALSGISYHSKNSKYFSSLRIKGNSTLPKPGIVLVGSHIELADQQLRTLLKHSNCEGVELPVNKIAKILEESSPDVFLPQLEKSFLHQIKNTLSKKKTPVLYTSRGELHFSSLYQRIDFGISLAKIMARLTANVLNDLGYIISKGGITTNILLSYGLKLNSVNLKGQILPGLSVVLPYEEEKVGPIPILTFPGNLGDHQTLLAAWERMQLD